MNKKILFVLFMMITSVFSRFEVQFNDNNITIFEIVNNHYNNEKVDKYLKERVEQVKKNEDSLKHRKIQKARNQKLVIKLTKNTDDERLYCTYDLYNFKSAKIRIFRPHYFTIQDCFDIMKHDYFIYLPVHYHRENMKLYVDEYILDFIDRYIYSLELYEKINKLKENNIDIEDLF